MISRLSSNTLPGMCHMVYQMDCTNTIKANMPIADLIIADPPYFKVVGEKWDYQWRTEQEYLDWCAKWLSSCHHQLRLGGSMYLFGYFRTLALLLPKLKEIGFSLRQQIVIDKGIKAVAGRATKNYKMFPCTTESVLLLTKDNIQFSRKFLKERQEKLGLTAKEINEALGVKSNGGGMWSIYTGKNVCEQFPTREVWEKLQQVLKFDMDYDSIAEERVTDAALRGIYMKFQEVTGRTVSRQETGKIADAVRVYGIKPEIFGFAIDYCADLGKDSVVDRFTTETGCCIIQ